MAVANPGQFFTDWHQERSSGGPGGSSLLYSAHRRGDDWRHRQYVYLEIVWQRKGWPQRLDEGEKTYIQTVLLHQGPSSQRMKAIPGASYQREMTDEDTRRSSQHEATKWANRWLDDHLVPDLEKLGAVAKENPLWEVPSDPDAREMILGSLSGHPGRKNPETEGYPDDAVLPGPHGDWESNLSCLDAKGAVLAAMRNIPNGVGTDGLHCTGVYVNEGGGLFWLVRGRGFGKHLAWKEGGKVRTIPVTCTNFPRYRRFRISEVPAIKVLAMLGKPNPRTALRWTYDPSKMQWVAEHAGRRWFLERRDGGDPRYPREYLYQTTLGGRYMDRVAKRDAKPVLTASARKRRNIRAKEWAEGFILSDLEKLARSMKKNPKKKGKRKRRERGIRRGAGTVPAPMMRISSAGFPSTRADPDYYPPKPWGRREDAWQKQISIGDRVLVMLGSHLHHVGYAVGTVLAVDERREWEKKAQVRLDPTGGQHPWEGVFYYDEIVEVIKPGHPLLQLAELGSVENPSRNNPPKQLPRTLVLRWYKGFATFFKPEDEDPRWRRFGKHWGVYEGDRLFPSTQDAVYSHPLEGLLVTVAPLLYPSQLPPFNSVTWGAKTRRKSLWQKPGGRQALWLIDIREPGKRSTIIGDKGELFHTREAAMRYADKLFQERYPLQSIGSVEAALENPLYSGKTPAKEQAHQYAAEWAEDKGVRIQAYLGLFIDRDVHYRAWGNRGKEAHVYTFDQHGQPRALLVRGLLVERTSGVLPTPIPGPTRWVLTGESWPRRDLPALIPVALSDLEQLAEVKKEYGRKTRKRRKKKEPWRKNPQAPWKRIHENRCHLMKDGVSYHVHRVGREGRDMNWAVSMYGPAQARRVLGPFRTKKEAMNEAEAHAYGDLWVLSKEGNS